MVNNSIDLKKSVRQYLFISYLWFPILFILGFIAEFYFIVDSIWGHSHSYSNSESFMLIKLLILPLALLGYLIWFFVKSHVLVRETGKNAILFSIFNVISLPLTGGSSLLIAPFVVYYLCSNYYKNNPQKIN